MDSERPDPRKAEVLKYAHYLYEGSNAPVSKHHYFCGECRLELPKLYTFPLSPDGINDPFRYDPNRKLIYAAFCQWCGVAFPSEWWMNQPIQNERPPDHFTNPGTHTGDKLIFAFDPVGHYLSTSDGSPCWCAPIVEPHEDGCVITHRDVPKPPPQEPTSEAEEEYCSECGQPI